MERPRTTETPAPSLLHQPRAQLWLGAGLLLLLVLCVRGLSMIPAVINPDESIFALAAREVLLGHLPYETLFDNKPVGSTLILAAAGWLFGQDVLTVRLVGALFVWLAALAVAALCRQAGLSRLQSWLGAMLFVAFTTRMGGLATLTETLLTPFTALAVLLLHRMLAPASPGRRLMLAATAGLACGFAVLIKIVPIVPGCAVAATVAALLLARRQIGVGKAAALAAVFAVSSAVPMLAAGAVYWRAGLLGDFLYSNFGFARAYAGVHPSLTMTAQRLGTTIDSLWPLLLLAAIGLAAQAREWRRTRAAPVLPLLAAAWVAGELAGASASLQFFPHYFLPAVAPLAILSLFGIQALVQWIGAASPAPRAHAVLALAAAAIAVEASQVELVREMHAMREPERIAAAIAKAQGSATPRLLVTSYRLSALYSLTGSPLPPTRYAVAAHLLSRQSAMIRADPSAEVARVLRSRPDYLVIDEREHVPAWARSQIAGALSQDYRPFYASSSIKVYRANDAGEAQRISAARQNPPNH